MHWLPVEKRIEFKIFLFNNLQDHKRPVCILLEALRSGSLSLLCPQRARTDNYGGRVFPVAAPKWWDVLPQNIKEAKTVDSFKKLLKTFLFRQTFLNS